MADYGCRWTGVPHDFVPVGETKRMKVERCTICNVRKAWSKDAKGRVRNADYLFAHARNYAQKGGLTRRLFAKLYEPEKCVISL